MPNKNKYKKASPFMVFVMEYKEKHNRNMPLQKAIDKAGIIWSTMPEQEKARYKDRAKNDISIQLNRNSTKTIQEKLTSQGVPISHIENEKREREITERVMKKEIQDIVKNSRKNDDLPNLKLFFVMGNYFLCNKEGGIYLPAEIAISEFSLKDGITNKFHSFINPGDVFFGYAYEAREHSEKTHRLPLYPNALGEKDLGKLYIEILKFICKEDCNDGSNLKPPAIYTHADSVPVIRSMLRYLRQDCIFDNVPEIRIYPMQYLFYTLKMATTEIGESEQPFSIYITDAVLEKDIYESTANLSCNYHEENDRTKYCALSCVIRWGYIFADNMCMDLAITMKPGQHCPFDTDMRSIINSVTIRTFNDDDDDDDKNKQLEHKSFWELKSETEFHYYDPSTSEYIKTEDDYPSLGSKSTRKTKPKTEY